MAKNTKQVAMMQHRRGKLSELPKQLNEGEFGLALDTNEVFIGNSTNPALAERIASNTFPYGNIQILTEFTDNLQKIIYRYKSNTDVKARLPIIAKGTTEVEPIPTNYSVKINGVEIIFYNKSDIDAVIKKINTMVGPTTKAFREGNYLTIITTDNYLILEDGVNPNPNTPGAVEKLGFGVKTFSEVSSLPPERTLQERLDDTVSVKSFGAFGNGTSINDGKSLFNGIIALNKAGVDDAKYYRTLFIPSGTYLSDTVIPLPYGTHLKGEGIKRTVIKSSGFSDALFVSMDSNMTLSTNNTYGIDANPAMYVTVEDMTIDVSETNSSCVLSLASCKNIVFRNVEFIGSSGTELIKIEDSSNPFDGSLHILFEGCTFKNGERGIVANGNLEHLVVKNCTFENIPVNSILLDTSEEKLITNSIIEGNYFRNCSKTDERINTSVIFLGEHTSYISTINNRFDEDNSDFSQSKSYETLSNKNYTDILDPLTDVRKVLQFNFTQPSWAYVDYLLNPNGEYVIKSKYNKQTINGEEVVSELTNGFILSQGDVSNNDTATFESSSKTGNLSITNGIYGKIKIGETLDTPYQDWLRTNLYNVGDRVQIVDYDLSDYNFKGTVVSLEELPQENNVENDYYIVTSLNEMYYWNKTQWEILTPKILNNTYSLYECIKEITDEDIRNNRDIEPHIDSIFWTYLGVFNPVISVYKQLDLNGNAIIDQTSNITFKTTNNNYIEVDDSQSIGDYSYAERIATNPDAIPNVDYVNTIAQTTIRKKFDYKVIQNIGTNKQEIIYFDPNIYGGFINMNFINVNVRRPFYPVLSKLDEALEWRSGSKYYSGDVIKTLIDDISQPDFEMKINTLEQSGFEWEDEDTSTFKYPSEVDGDGRPSKNYPPEGGDNIYAVYVDNTERNIFYRSGYIWYKLGTKYWKDLYPSYAETNEASGDYEIDSKIKIVAGYDIDPDTDEHIMREYLVTLSSEPSLENFKKDIMEALPEDSGINITINGSTLRIAQEGLNKGVLELYNEDKNALEQVGFELEDNGLVKVKTVEFLKTFDSQTFNPSDYIPGTVWVKSQGIPNYFTCIYDNIASDTFNNDLGQDGSIAKWVEIDETDINGDPLKDLKYVSILAQANDTVDDDTGELKEHEERLLFLKNIIEADRRDFHSIYQQEFDSNITYSKGDRCLYAGRYWECLAENTPGEEGPYVLHNPDLWLAVPEEGFNYHFDFERDTYLLDENDNIITSNEVVLDYNFSDYHFFLMFYDADQKRLVPYAVDYDIPNYMKYKGTVDNVSELPRQGMEINDYYIVKVTETFNEIYYWDGDMWVKLDPKTNLCVSPAGNITVNINYLRGQGEDIDED